MKEKERDILAETPELKKMPYTVPEGYFDSFRSTVMQSEPSPRRRMNAAYLSIAASFLLLLGAGLLLLQKLSPPEEFTQEDYLVFSGSMTNTEYYRNENQLADAEIAEEDIIDYLIYSGITVEEIENFNNR